MKPGNEDSLRTLQFPSGVRSWFGPVMANLLIRSLSLHRCLSHPALRGLTAAKRANLSTPSSGNSERFRLTLETLNPSVTAMRYEVRGKVPQAAMKIEEDLKKVCKAVKNGPYLLDTLGVLFL